MGFVEGYIPVSYDGTSMFNPIKVGNMQLSHHVVMAPLTRMRVTRQGNVPKDIMIEYYDQRSRREGSLIIGEAAIISAEAGGYDNIPGVWSGEQLSQWCKIIGVVHRNKSFIWPQLWALGRISFPEVLAREGYRFVSPSEEVYIDAEQKNEAIRCDNRLHGLSKLEMQQYKTDYINCAKKLINIGADGIELHLAYGCLLNQFLDPISNKRLDEYGGSIENRCKFILEIIDGLIIEIGCRRVGIRLSPFDESGGMSGDNDPTLLSTYMYLIGRLEEQGKMGERIAYIHLVEPSRNKKLKGISNDFIYSIWKGIVIRCGNLIYNSNEAKMYLEKHKNTLIAYGKYFISNPDLVTRLEKKLLLNKFDESTFYTSNSKGYTDYLTYEEEMKKKK
ncbi:hypothetical protein Kpol_370p4 [Vanderwaltozyma polyspora DSM 70294]|uniref:NADH:flavin oxidoreductase/NADH oxidase N-terminal domain-containing protein n=1 Tax=Vanderwaltozyma polyspora (strain ATCC 22028 / DSM 70294 / BCRC 21397 / CBS 2163 / NBRC 10782 / NRRL Y-8283 / UCD 57-17) TaxID=436907 RepID=A7TSH7_VANPO|nr:uncharacterized protein Kpol_370p4 [Vanderwaltozyma polyspora DSM 70294]EDO14776.1 hypothetical protein Kpol_370p4 [Vanderwaltozyma polyspora DSM 70294]